MPSASGLLSPTRSASRTRAKGDPKRVFAAISTDRQIVGLKPGSARYERVISGPKGLVIVISPDGRRAFYLRYVAKAGARRRLLLGTYSDAFGLADARKLANIRRAGIEQGADPAVDRSAERSEARTGETLDQVQEAYMEAAKLGIHGGRKRARRASALDQHARTYRKHIQPKLGAQAVRQITEADVTSFMEGLVKRGGLATATVNSVGGVLRAVLAFAKFKKKIRDNPAMGNTTPFEHSEREREIEAPSLRLLWRALTAGSVPQPDLPIEPTTALALKLLFLTSLRCTEVSGARWEEFDLPARVWTVPAARMKGGRTHVVPLADPTLQLLELIKSTTSHRQSEYLFPSTRDAAKPIGRTTMGHALAHLSEHLKLPACSPHDVRRTCMTTMTGERYRVRRFIMSHVLAHAAEDGAKVSAQYDRTTYLTEKREALATWALHLDSMLSSPAPEGGDNVVSFKSRSAS